MAEARVVGRPFRWHILLPTGERAGVYRLKHHALRDLAWYRRMEYMRWRESNVPVCG